jgi:hypothetical protein
MMPFTPKLPQQLKLEPCYKLLHSTPMPDMTEDLEDVHNQETEEILDQIAALLENRAHKSIISYLLYQNRAYKGIYETSDIFRELERFDNYNNVDIFKFVKNDHTLVFAFRIYGQGTRITEVLLPINLRKDL